MVSSLNITIAFFWVLSAFIDYSNLCYVWQLKWYRVDRFKDFLSTEQGKRFAFSYTIFWRSVAIFFFFLLPFDSVPTFKWILLFFYIIDFIHTCLGLYRRKIKHPTFSLKAILIVAVSMIVEASWLLYSRDWYVLLFALILRFFIIAIVVFVLNTLTNLIKKYFFYRAEKKLRHFPGLTVIGITGSYGKTTVKEFLYQILSTKFKVVRTPKNVNSDIGISRFILSTDFEGVDVFIVEIGAYARGDVQLVCDIIHPKIGILTAINAQHLSLFGSLKNIQDTKYELLRSLPRDGLAITNSDNPYCIEYIHELDCRVETFGTEEENNPTCLITDIHTGPQGVGGTVRFRKGSEIIEGSVETHLVGEHNALNVAPCLLVASFLGMHRKENMEAVRNLKNPENMLRIYSYGSTTIIDDSYNSNPDGFRAALFILSKYPSHRRRIVVTRGMLELGDLSNELHRQIGGEIAFIGDELVIITPDFIEPLTQGVGTKYNTEITIKTNPEKLVEYMKKFKSTDSVILLENRIPAVFKKELDQKM
ncbi:MAG: UDP-N-acetylmuramoyl-tripeptide--D-alanyl-D-alanine ligase [Candidatus Magasanikbacteria bacterium]